MSTPEPNNIKSADLCDRCVYDITRCRFLCIECPLDEECGLCKCRTIRWGTPCPYFKESEE